ncbi:MAG: DNA alkylation repair protein, partial [Bacteroidota bacterium]
HTDWVIKHGCRTLLKPGHPEVLALFGFGSVKGIKVDTFQICTPEVKIGEVLEFTFRLIHTAKTPVRIRLEYGLYYRKANGSLSKKVFKISEKEYPGDSMTTIHRKQSFKRISTRNYYIGEHQLSLIVNGQELEKSDFELIG